MALGAYFRAVESQPIPEPQLDGLGSQDQFAVEALQELLEAQGIRPAAAMAPWGIQEGSVDWQAEHPDHSLLLYPISDGLLTQVEKSTFGMPVPAVAILTTTPVVLAKAREAYDDTPYRFHAVEGVYRLDDKKPVPTIYFLYWGHYREPNDSGGGRSALQSVASMLGGSLVFPLQLPRTGQERQHPSVTFQLALAAQLSGQPAAALPPTAVPSALAPSAAPAPSAAWWLLPVVGGLAAYGGYRWWKGRKS
jgi:hypothetical protein